MNVKQLLIALERFDLNRENEIAEINKLEPQDRINSLNCWILCKEFDILCKK